MGLNDTPASNRVHIGFFGRRNAGKSSVVNAVTGQELAVVSDTKGTTTDPVLKSMELLPLGPVVIIDTPGYDDEGSLGALRVKKTRQVLNKTDIAVLVTDGQKGIGACEEELLSLFREKEIPYLIVCNKSDLLKACPPNDAEKLYVSTKNGGGDGQGDRTERDTDVAWKNAVACDNGQSGVWAGVKGDSKRDTADLLFDPDGTL